MPKRKTNPVIKPKQDEFDILYSLIQEYAEAKIADSWKGGGHPLEGPVIEAELKLAEEKLLFHIGKIRSSLGVQ